MEYFLPLWIMNNWLSYCTSMSFFRWVQYRKELISLQKENLLIVVEKERTSKYVVLLPITENYYKKQVAQCIGKTFSVKL